MAEILTWHEERSSSVLGEGVGVGIAAMEGYEGIVGGDSASMETVLVARRAGEVKGWESAELVLLVHVGKSVMIAGVVPVITYPKCSLFGGGIPEGPLSWGA